uniref:Uncharacterized protein n=1 Tax=Rhizophora mucronata TaxID=61149 RepID=A0A2P2QVX8_RHIMU
MLFEEDTYNVGVFVKNCCCFIVKYFNVSDVLFLFTMTMDIL